MAIKTERFDAADYLNTPEEIAAYLDTWLEDGTPEEIRTALGTIARARGMGELAKRLGISRPGLYKALSEAGNPSFDLINALVKALGGRLSVAAPVREAEMA